MIKFKVTDTSIKRSGQHIPSEKRRFIRSTMENIEMNMYIDMMNELTRLDFDDPCCSGKNKYEIEVFVKFRIKRRTNK